MTRNIIKKAICLCALVVITPNIARADDAPKKGRKTFTIHYLYHPVGYSEVPGVGKITTLEASGQVENMKGESVPLKEPLKVKCQMVSIEAAGNSWTEGACITTDADGDLLFSTFDSRKVDKSQPKMNCGTYDNPGGTGKFKSYAATGAYACVLAEAPKGEPAGSFAMDVSHIENWQTR